MFFVKSYYGHVLLLALSFVPVAIWIIDTGFSDITASPGKFIASLGKAGAFSGFAMFLMMPILSMRHNLINTLFGGIDTAYRLHKLGGKLSILLIIAHPLLLGAGRLMQGRPLTSVWDWSSLLVVSGIVAFLAFLTVSVVSIYSHVTHQRWVWVHRVFGWLIPLFFIHAVIARSVMVSIAPLFGYFIVLGIAGFCAFMYRSVLHKYLVKRYRYVVSEVNRFGDKIVEIVLKPVGVPLSFIPGQFAYVAFSADGIDTESHPFSISNSNNGPYVRFTVKVLGDDTANFHKLQPGTSALLEGPYGSFSFRRVKNPKQVWIAGGIGITPFLSMARSFSGKKQYDIRFFYATESLDEAVFLAEFMDITRYLPKNFRTSVVSKDISGYVTADLVCKSLAPELMSDFDYMICGPPGMMAALRSQLLQAGVSEHQIHIESFSMR